MFNKVILAGNLTRDIELRYTQGGSAIASTAVATNRKFKKQDGSQGEEVCFVDITFFGRTAEIANQYLKRGSKVLVEGRLKFDQWTDQNGGKRSKHSIVIESLQMLGSKNDDTNNPQQYNQPNQQNTSNQQYNQPNQQNTSNQQQNNARGYEKSEKIGKQQQQIRPEIPDIDIDEDEIPF